MSKKDVVGGGWHVEGFARGSNLTICVYLGSWRPLSDTSLSISLFHYFSPIFRNVTIIHRIDNLKIFTSAIFLFENVYKYIRFVVKTLLLFVTKNQAFSSNFFSSLNCTFDVKTTIDLARKKISLTWKFENLLREWI